MVVDGRAPWWKVEPGGDVTRGAFEVTSDYRENGTKYVAEGFEIPLVDELNGWKRLVAECGDDLRVWPGWAWRFEVRGERLSNPDDPQREWRKPTLLARDLEHSCDVTFRKSPGPSTNITDTFTSLIELVLEETRRAAGSEGDPDREAQPDDMLGNTRLGDITLIGRYSPTGKQNGDTDDNKEHSVSNTQSDPAEELSDLLREHKNVILEGVAGCGKTHAITELREGHYKDRTEVVVFHPSTSYEEFVSGLRPDPQDGSRFRGVAGTFVEMCERAAKDPDNDYLLCIDEINRANTSRVLGDLLMPLEKSKRVDAKQLARPDGTTPQAPQALSVDPPQLRQEGDGETETEGGSLVSCDAVRLQTPVDDNRYDDNRYDDNRYDDNRYLNRYLIVPRNLHVLGTMNTTDRSVGTIDLALRRRFHWHSMEPLGKEELEQKLGLDEHDNDADNDLKRLIQWYAELNDWLNKNVGPDARLGHSYFFSADPETVEYQLLHQLQEIVFAFHVRDDDAATDGGSPFHSHAPLSRRVIRWVGKGLGERPLTCRVGDKSERVQDEGADQESESA